MIRSFRHRGLKRLYDKGDGRGVSAELLPRIEEVLGHLDCAMQPQDMDLPGYHLHILRGKLNGYWSVRISGNYRLIFRMEAGDAYDVNLVDYH